MSEWLEWAHPWHSNRQHIVLSFPAHTFSLKSNSQKIPQLWYTLNPGTMESQALQFSFMEPACTKGWLTRGQTTYWPLSWSWVITNKSGRGNITKPHYLASWSSVRCCWWLRSDSRGSRKKPTIACKPLKRESSICAKMS